MSLAKSPNAGTLAQVNLPSDADHTGRDLGEEELFYLRQVIKSGTLNCTKGTQVKAFEASFAKRFGVPYARAVSSGTAAIHAAIAAIDPEPGDEIITTPITDMGAITPILYQRAIPVFADVDPTTLNITPETVAEQISSRTRAIIATHLFGLPCDVIGIKRLADKHAIPVIEDCAQAFLATQNGRLVGTIGAIGTFSLQQGKHMTTGEGGVVITSDPALARRIVLFSDKGWGYGDPEPDHYFLALNYRMTELQGAVARAQLAKLDGVVKRRQESARQLIELLGGLGGVRLPEPPPGRTHAYWKFPLIVDPEAIPGGADALGAALKERGIACAPRYIRKLAFECEVLAAGKGHQQSCDSYGTAIKGQLSDAAPKRARYPGAAQGLERVVVLPWNEAYGKHHLTFISQALLESTFKIRNGGRTSP